jgi:hypothetical protein
LQEHVTGMSDLASATERLAMAVSRLERAYRGFQARRPAPWEAEDADSGEGDGEGDREGDREERAALEAELREELEKAQAEAQRWRARSHAAGDSLDSIIARLSGVLAGGAAPGTPETAGPQAAGPGRHVEEGDDDGAS